MSRKFGHEKNLKCVVVVSTTRLRGEVNFFIRVVFEVFYFTSEFIFIAEKF